jgi:hypothetical protein
LIDYSNKYPQFEILIPVETRDEIEQLQRASSMELTEFRPQLRSDRPQEQRAEDLPGALIALD